MTGNHGGGGDFWVVRLSPVLGIEEIRNPVFSIYPNPVSQNFTLTTEPDETGRSYTIADQLGQVILVGRITSTRMEFDLASFASGTYYLSINGTQGSIKVVKH